MDCKIDRQFALSAGIACAIGLAITYWPVMFVASIAVPALTLRQRKRLHSTAVAFSYYAGAIWLAIPAAKAFFGPTAGVTHGIVIWSCGAALLSLPYALLWRSNARFIGLRSAAAVLMSVPPPLGIIGVASPLTAAGLLFPGTAWFGLLATLVVVAALALRPVASAIILAAIATLSNFAYPGAPKPPSNWVAVNTHFGDIGRSAQAEFESAEFIQQRALNANASVIIFPETVAPRWTEATDLFWEPTLDALTRSGKTVLIGTTFDIPGNPGYENGAVIRGAQTGRFLQQIPVPIAMWNPLSSSSVPVRVAGPHPVTISEMRAMVLICYEQLLSWPAVVGTVDRPTILIGMANEFWVRQTRLPRLQSALLQIWARLLGIPVISARNSVGLCGAPNISVVETHHEPTKQKSEN